MSDIIFDEDLVIEGDPNKCPAHLDPRHYEGYRLMFAWGHEPEGLKRGCPLGRSASGYGGLYGAVADLLFRTSCDNLDVTFTYKGQWGHHSFRNGKRV